MAHEAPSDVFTFDKVLRILSPSTKSSNLYKHLTFIRKFVEWPKHRKNIVKIQKSGCIKKILACLSSTQSDIIAISLSILGNCCLEFKCANEVASIGLNELYNLLQKYSNKDGVNGRVFRIVGNICECNRVDFILKSKSHVFTYILHFIQNYADNDDSKFTENTLLMAVRAISKFLNRSSLTVLVDKYDMLRPIGALFIKCCMRWTTEKKDKNILENIIKFLYLFSKYKYSPGISQLRSTSRGNCLVYFKQVLSLAPQIIVKIVMNFISLTTLKSELPVRDITAGLVTLLREISFSGNEIKMEHVVYIKCLCFLMDSPINRDLERCDETIPQLIKTMDNIKQLHNDMIEIFCLILRTFERCIYHRNILKYQLENNVLEVIITKMEMLLGSRKYLKIKHKFEKKRKRKIQEESKKLFWDSLPCSSDEEIEIPYIAPFSPSSPSGSDSELVTSPWTSPRASTPPSGSNTFYLQESDSEDYSPVCSENEDNDRKSPKLIEGQRDDSSESENKSEYENNRRNMEKISEEDLKYKLIIHCLSLLKIYSNIQPLPSQLCTDSMIRILVKCACCFDPTSRATILAKKVILKILSENNNLLPLMQTDVIFDIFSLHKTDHGPVCRLCNHFQNIGQEILERFTILIESGVGRGVIANKLMCGNEGQKRQLVMAIPYIVRCKTTLHTLMISCNGVKILLGCLRDESLRRKSIEVLTVLVKKHLNILSPIQWALSKKKMFIGEYNVSEECENVVTFILDDDSSLRADRNILIDKSHYFNRLLNGSFKESKEECVKLRHTNYHSLKCLIYLLNCDMDMSEPKNIQLEITILLDVIMLCHRYLLDELCLYLTICVKQFCLSAESIPIIYKWSLESGTNILRSEIISYILSNAINDCDISIFMQLFDLSFTELLIEDIEKLLSSYMNLFRYEYK